MKFKALLLSLLMLLPLVIVAAPLTNATIGGPVLWVNPKDTKKWAPCLVSSTFDVEVKLWNKKDLTGVGVYAFDFNITWFNSTFAFPCGAKTDPMITLVGVSFTAPWDHYFVIKNETIPSFYNASEGVYMTGYHLAITALDNSTALTEVQVSLLKLTFHIDCEPLYPDTLGTPFFLSAILSDVPDKYGHATPLALQEIDSGTFLIESYRPDVHLEPEEWCEYKVGVCHTVEVWFSNISKAYGFGFAVTYNNTLLEADVQSIHFCDAFPPPYEFLMMTVTDNGDGTSTLIVQMARPCEKPTVTHQPGPAATFCLESIFAPVGPTGLPLKYQIAYCENSTITLDWAYLLAKCGCAADGQTYEYWYGPGTPAIPGAKYYPLFVNAEDTTEIAYYWRPRIGDLNLDGAVDIQDLQALAKVYGKDLGAFGWGYLDGTNTVVDIFDFVVVAKYFGKPYTCVITKCANVDV